MMKSMIIPMEDVTSQYVSASLHFPGTRGSQYLRTGSHINIPPKNPYSAAPRATMRSALHSLWAQGWWKSRRYWRRNDDLVALIRIWYSRLLHKTS